jgi:hypothetical protein
MLSRTEMQNDLPSCVKLYNLVSKNVLILKLILIWLSEISLNL